MKLRETILAEHSKTQTLKIIKWIGNNPARFKELFQLFSSNEYRVAQRAAWPLSYIVEANPGLINPYWKKLLELLKKKDAHPAIRRNGLRLMENIEIPEPYHGLILNYCFDFICDPQEKPAVKAFSLTVLQNLLKTYPEIGRELKLIIEEQWDRETAAFRSRAKKILHELKDVK